MKVTSCGPVGSTSKGLRLGVFMYLYLNSNPKNGYFNEDNHHTLLIFFE